MKKYILIYILVIAALACGCDNTKKTLSPGDWLFELQLDENDKFVVLPINAKVISEKIIFSNDEENQH